MPHLKRRSWAFLVANYMIILLERTFVTSFNIANTILFSQQKRFNSPMSSRRLVRDTDPLQAKRISSSHERNADNTQMNDASSSPPERIVEFKLHSSIGSIPAEMWDACLTNTSSPFISHAWLRCMEESKCASPATGWVPSHVSIIMDSQAVGFVPLYIKGHSLGEFIFDQQFAEAAYQNGIDYYPKLLVGVPFTPATGNRILWHPQLVLQTFSREEIQTLNQSVAQFLKQLASSNKVSSVHINFLTELEADDLGGPLPRPLEDSEDVKSSAVEHKIRSIFQRLDIKDNYLRRTSLQYHWQNSNPNDAGKPFESFDDYLSCFKSKKRINIRRERKKVLEEEGVVIDAIAGKDILQYPGLVERMFEIYLSTIDKMVWGRQYLTMDFFQLLARSDFIDHLVFVCARQNVPERQQKLEASDVFAGTFNIVKDGVFYGRYWGCLPDREVKNLHFECCYWSAIDYCIRTGLRRMEPGAGGGDYKWARGFDPALIHSVHYICHPGLRRAVGQFLIDETESNVELTKFLLERSAVGNRQLSTEKF